MEMEGEKMDKKKKPGPTLPVPVSVEQQQRRQQQARAAPSFLHTDVKLVNLWKFFNAFIIVTINVGFLVVDYMLISGRAMHYVSPRVLSWLLPRPRAVTKTADADDGSLASALMTVMLWWSTPQAAGVALGLLLLCQRGRVGRAAAYPAVASTVAGHCMYAGAFLTGQLIWVGYQLLSLG